MHLYNFSEGSTREDCGGTIYLGIMREAFYIFYGLILLLQGLFYSILLNFVELKIKNPDPILTVKRIEWRKFIYYFLSKY